MFLLDRQHIHSALFFVGILNWYICTYIIYITCIYTCIYIYIFKYVCSSWTANTSTWCFFCGACCITLQKIITDLFFYNALQHTATHCKTSHHTATNIPDSRRAKETRCSKKSSSLHYMATQGNTGQHIATRCNKYTWRQACKRDVLLKKLQHTTTHCNKIHHTAEHCITLQHTVTRGNIPQHTTTRCDKYTWRQACERDVLLEKWQLTATHCNSMRHTATPTTLHNTLQDTATHCKTLQHTARHCNKYTWRQACERDVLLEKRQITATNYNKIHQTTTHHNTLQKMQHAATNIPDGRRARETCCSKNGTPNIEHTAGPMLTVALIYHSILFLFECASVLSSWCGTCV